MKRILFIVFLIFIFCFAAFAETNKDSCKEIQINAPESVRPGETFNVSANYKEAGKSNDDIFNWIIIENDEKTKEKVFKINNEKSIEIKPGESLNEGGIISVIVEFLIDDCQKISMAKVLVIPIHTDTHYLITTYLKTNWNLERVHLDHAVETMKSFKNAELFVWIEFEENTDSTKKIEHLKKILEHLNVTRGFMRSRITFLISESDLETTKLKAVPQDLVDSYFCDNCIKIKGEDLNRMVDLFQLNTKN